MADASSTAVDGQDEGEDRSLTGFAPDIDTPAVTIGDSGDDRQAEAGTAVPSAVRRLTVGEALEDSLTIDVGDARAGVRDADSQRPAECRTRS